MEAVPFTVESSELSPAFSYLDGQALQGMTAGVTSSFEFVPRVGHGRLQTSHLMLQQASAACFGTAFFKSQTVALAHL